jgi:hypothetical protein
MPRTRLRDDAGQAATELAGLLGVVAVLLGAGLAVWPSAAAEVPGAVGRGMLRALCVVRDGDCERDRAPCVVAGTQTREGWRATLGVVELGAGWTGLVERRSDGTYVVTRVREDVLGATFGAGAKGRLSLAGTSFVAGGEARARLLLGRGDALTWTVPDRAAADRLVRALRADRVASASGSGLLRLVVDRVVALPPPDGAGRDVGPRAEAALSGGLGVAAATVDLAAAGAVGRRALAGGGRVAYLRLEGSAAGALQAGVAGVEGRRASGETSEAAGSASGLAAGTLVLGLETDAAGRAVDLSLVRTGTLEGSADLPPELAEVAGRLGIRSGAAPRRTWSAEHHLDLTVPEHARAARAVLDALARRSAGPLGRLLRERGTVEARTYAVDEREEGAAGTVRVGVGIGLEAGRTTTTTRLLAAASRGPDGAWRTREDCRT